MYMFEDYRVSNNRMQIDTKSLKNRQIAEKYLILSESGQCLTLLEKFKPASLDHKILQFQAIDQRQMFVLMVQTVYLLYTAYSYQINIKISKNIYIRFAGKDVFEIYRVYMIEEHFHSVDANIQELVTKHYQTIEFSNNFQFQVVIANTLSFFLNKIQVYSQRYPEYLCKGYKAPFEQFVSVFTQLLIPNMKLIKQPKRLIECLEKTQVFRDNSLLINLSMSLVYQKIRPFIEQGILFAELREMQQTLKKQLQRNLNSTVRYKAICNFIDIVLKYLVHHQIICLNVSLDQKNKPRLNQPKEPQYFQKGGQQAKQQKQVYIENFWQIHTKSHGFMLKASNFTEYAMCTDSTSMEMKFRQDLGANKINHYAIEVDKEREMISAKIFCNLPINNENIDNIIYQINTVSEDWYYPIFQFVDGANSPKGLENPHINKRLALRINFKLSPNKSTISRLLVILDVLLVHQRAFLTELTKPPYKKSLPHRYNLSMQNIERMNVLLLKNIERVYDVQMSGDIQVQ